MSACSSRQIASARATSPVDSSTSASSYSNRWPSSAVGAGASASHSRARRFDVVEHDAQVDLRRFEFLLLDGLLLASRFLEPAENAVQIDRVAAQLEVAGFLVSDLALPPRALGRGRRGLLRLRLW